MDEKVKILIVDDEESTRNIVGEHLKEEWSFLDFAKDGQDALCKLNQNLNYNVVIVDLKMPDINGIELIRKTKKYNPNISFIVMTGYGTLDDAILSLKEEVVDFLKKPFSKKELTLSVKKALEKQKTQLAKNSLINNLKKENEQLKSINKWLEKLNKSLEDFIDYKILQNKS